MAPTLPFRATNLQLSFSAAQIAAAGILRAPAPYLIVSSAWGDAKEQYLPPLAWWAA